VSDGYAFLIVGGGPAGLAAARAYRAAGGGGRVAIVTDESRLPYMRPPLTKDLLRGESRLADLPIEAEAFFDDHAIELIAGRAVALDGPARTVTLSGGRAIAYEQCLLSTGGEPKRLPIPGADHPRVFVMRTIEDLRRLNDALGAHAEVAVVGSGFIGAEIAASLCMGGHDVDLISSESAPNVTRLGIDAAGIIGSWLAAEGVGLRLGHPVENIEHERGRCILAAGREHVTADVVVMGSGVGPRGELAGAAGIELDAGAIPVDASMRTAQEGIFAAGDVAKAQNRAAGRALRVEHWGDALGQGAVAGQTAAGVDAVWDAVPGFWSTIATHTLKYTAWGDGFDDVSFESHTGGGFTVRYGAAGALVGVLTHDADADHERAGDDIARGVAWTR
jgi:3-phenylpropionate/trans-cinnamate dioxygenase ferredoxin reductase subunit